MNGKWKGNLILLLTALIWGAAFVAQSAGMEYVEPLTYNGVRTLLGGLVLLPVILLLDRLSPERRGLSPEKRRAIRKNSAVGGVCCGVLLCVASSLQQYGLCMTTAGKAGFITALYIVIVPFLGVFFHQKIPAKMWLCVLLAVLGFYLLCVKEGFSVSLGDWLVLGCAVVFSLHILAVDHFTAREVDGVRMACIQFLTAGVLTLIGAFCTETPEWSGILAARGTILYAGVMSCGVGYTLQILGQRRTDPTSATLLMSLESVFAAVFGWLFLRETLTVKEWVGCVLVFAAVLLAQLPWPRLKRSQMPHS